jgi:predicted N-acetyltransferase YhbS
MIETMTAPTTTSTTPTSHGATDDRSPVTLRPGRPEDAAACAAICFQAFGGINARHGFPSDFPAREPVDGMMGFVFSQPFVDSVVAERDGRIVGSNFLWHSDAVGGVGPITVDPAVQGGSVGRRLMEHVIERGRELKLPAVRLVQAAFNTTSMTLYTKLGFEVREPLVCLQGGPLRATVAGYAVRKASGADVAACNDVCRRVHGHERGNELAGAIAQGTATVVERGSEIVGYATDIGFFGHAVAFETAGLLALIGAAQRVSGPGLLLPSRNGEAFRWCLERGLRMVQPMTLMSTGLYNEPRGAFVPSILF